MASISATVEPTTVIEARDHPNERWGHIAVITFDDVNVYLGGLTTPEDADAKIVASADLLIDKLTELRVAALTRGLAAFAASDLALLDADSPAQEHEADSCGACVAQDERELGQFDLDFPAQEHEVVAEWTRPETLDVERLVAAAQAIDNKAWYRDGETVASVPLAMLEALHDALWGVR